jgi:replication-associated recombination protein RarA
MSIKNSLLWEKWRPKTIDEIILLPRIRKQFQDGISQHYIFYGHFGTGKTSLARILIGRYSKETAFLEVNCSEETSIDYLRDEISKFCKTIPMFETKSDVKYVFLDEFERVSANYQDAFKAFIEKYNNKGVRFILSTNHIDKIRGGIKSRIKMINFNCQNAEEEKYLKIEMFKRIKEKILPTEGKDIEKPNLISIINKKFPDFRNIIVEVQDFLEVGEEAPGSNTASLKTKEMLYSMVYGEGGYENTYHFLMSTFGDEKISEMFDLMGRPFIQWCIERGKDVDKLFECNHIVAEYVPKLENSADPIVLGMSAIGKFRKILKRD